MTALKENTAYEARFLLLCTGQGTGLKGAKSSGIQMVSNEEPFTKEKMLIDDQHYTSIKRIYVAGICTGISSQAMIAAGHGAQAALNLISEIEGVVHIFIIQLLSVKGESEAVMKRGERDEQVYC
ncbi:hypothetical protein [Bacillus sp. NPDC093026]|uniref:hypothetical protein n=1 Tax=Bacillus sp. NPDC093026 TaxID=3363948 RepID=UPI0037FB5810